MLVCMCLYEETHTHVPLSIHSFAHMQRPEEGVAVLGARVTVICRMPGQLGDGGARIPNLILMIMQQVLLTTELFLQAPELPLLKVTG